MAVRKILNPYPKEGRAEEVWTHEEMDEARRTECLCRLCDRKNDDPRYSSCPTAAKIYAICVEDDMAMSITRCGARDEEGNLLYKPLKED